LLDKFGNVVPRPLEVGFGADPVANVVASVLPRVTVDVVVVPELFAPAVEVQQIYFQVLTF
jgi:hypothetical protein